MPATSPTTVRNVEARQFLVVKRFGKWRAKSLGRFGLPYANEANAIRATIERAEKSGRPATVARFTGNGAEVVWTFVSPVGNSVPGA